MIDLDAIAAQFDRASPVEFVVIAGRYLPVLFMECKQQAAEIEALHSELYPAKEIEERRAESWEAEKRLLQKTREQLASVTAERDAARERLCYTCKNGNPGAGIKHSASCDICPWRGQKGEAND